jgi:hypothetical protein
MRGNRLGETQEYGPVRSTRLHGSTSSESLGSADLDLVRELPSRETLGACA